MKILAINCKPDLSYFSKRGLKFDVDYITETKVFPLKFLYKVQDSDGSMVDTYTPDVGEYITNCYGDKEYAIILFGWSPTSYGEQVKHTGGYTEPNALPNGAMWATIRQDTVPNNNYVLHELHHILCRLLYTKNVYPVDFMDKDKFQRPYYLNDQPENPESNYAQTWGQISKFIKLLNDFTILPVVYLVRMKDNGVETLGNITYQGTTFKTLERPYKANKANVSAIPVGSYECKWTFSPRMLKYTYEVTNVPNRGGIRLHVANFWSELLGCISLGTGFADINKDGQTDLTGSRIAVDSFNKLMGGKPFRLIIKQ